MTDLNRDETKKSFFVSFLFKLVIIYVIPRMGRNFDDYLDFQQKAQK